jgi:hypothetical protein
MGVFGRIGQSRLQESESFQRRTGECDPHRWLGLVVHFLQNRFILYSKKIKVPENVHIPIFAE